MATLRVQAKNLENYPKLSENISTGQFSAFIDHLNYNDNREVIDKLTKVLKIVVSVGIGLIAIFSAIAVLVLFNTLRLTIYNRREEVEIMRLVGATNWYIRGPFVAESIMYSLAATVVTAVLLIPIYTRVLPQVAGFLGGPGLPISGLLSFWFLLSGLLAAALVLSVISTLLAIRKYLKI